MTPRAKIIHHLNHRVRIRITGVGRNKIEFFDTLEKKFKKKFNFQTILVNPVTGSAVFQDQKLDVESVVQYAKNEHLFMMEQNHTPARNLVPGSAQKQFKRLNKGILDLTGNRLDIASSVFLVLIFHAIRELVRGNLTAPSWFTALWFATTIYNRDFLGYGEGDYGHDSHGQDGGDVHA